MFSRLNLYTTVAALSVLSLFGVRPAMANRSVMEGIAASSNTVFVDTASVRLEVAESTYTGKVGSVSLAVASNVSVGNDGCVVYSSGSVGCAGNVSAASFGPGDGSKLSGIPSTGAISGTYVPYSGALQDVNIGNHNLAGTSSMTASAFFGDGSHLTGITSSGASLTSTQTWSGGNTLYGSTTFYGMAEFDSTTTVNGIFYAGRSTATTIVGTYNDNTGAGTTGSANCNMARSTITFTSRGLPLRFEFTGGGTTGSGQIFVTLVFDGDFAAKKMVGYVSGNNFPFGSGGSVIGHPEISIEIPAVSAGQHSLCATEYNAVAAAQLNCGTNGYTPCQIRMREITTIAAP